MDRTTAVALVLATGSVLATAVHESAAASFRYACMLLFPLGVIAFPEAIEAGYRRSWRGIGHGDDGPVPAIMVRIVAWILLIVLVVVHHYMTYAERST